MNKTKVSWIILLETMEEVSIYATLSTEIALYLFGEEKVSNGGRSEQFGPAAASITT